MTHARLIMTSIILLAGTSGCATTLSPQGFRVIEADDKMVRTCDFAGSVEGGSQLGGMSQERGMQNAKNRAIEEAAQRGATHVVIDRITGGYSPFVTGRAYRC